MKKHFWKRPLPGFSLLETSLVLVIAGVMFGAVLKGKNVLEQAKFRAVVSDFSNIHTAVALYENSYGQDLLDTPNEVWKKLSEVALWQSAEPPTSKLGGRFTFSVVSENVVLKLGSSSQKQALLTADQALAVMKQLKGEQSENVLVLTASDKVVDPVGLSTAGKGDRFNVAIILK